MLRTEKTASLSHCVDMKVLWVCFVLIGVNCYCCLAKKSSPQAKTKIGTNSPDKGVEAASARLRKELEELSSMAISYISINKFGKAVENISIAEILSKIIDTNVTGVLKRFPATCPNFSGADGVRTIKVSDLEPFEVLCGSNLFGAGWMMIQKRIDGNLNFFRNWTEYTLGFGNISHEFFIGLKKLHSITLLQQHELFVYMEDFEGGWRYALYDDFEIGSDAEFYALKKLGHYSGNAGDSLVYSRTAKFSTYDKDNDDYTESCAIKFMGAGWFKKCMQTNLNGLYLNGNYSSESGMKAKGVYWHHWHGSYYSLKTLSMMIRPKKTCPFFDGQP